jgi:hypothetical protein
MLGCWKWVWQESRKKYNLLEQPISFRADLRAWKNDNHHE